MSSFWRVCATFNHPPPSSTIPPHTLHNPSTNPLDLMCISFSCLLFSVRQVVYSLRFLELI